MKKCYEIMLVELMKCFIKFFGLDIVMLLNVGLGILFKFLKFLFCNSLVKLCFNVILKFGCVLKEVNILLVLGFMSVMYMIGNWLFSEVFFIIIGKFCFLRLLIFVIIFGYLFKIFWGMFGKIIFCLMIWCLIVCLKILDKYCIFVLVKLLFVFILLFKNKFLIRFDGK